MLKKRFKINNIPAVLWGEESNRIILAVHGDMSNKEDVPIEIVADYANGKGYQVLSFDLPEFGEREEEGTPCKVQFCVKDLTTVMKYAKNNWKQISLFANSIGAYFSLLAYKEEPIQKAWFLSPLVDMKRMIENMMMWFQVSEERLQEEQTIETPIGKTLYWDYYTYVKEHPIEKWEVPTFILHGNKDDTCEHDTITQFTDKFSCKLEIAKDAEHYFHTEEQLALFHNWLETVMQ